ncbi:hypothetical protein KSC_081810 [Ktedonobacter sp. SOSP1-52]|nr:hypothetical protein KSC_081810 [Ktedonobacter sp. SOSP1-52]
MWSRDRCEEAYRAFDSTARTSNQRMIEKIGKGQPSPAGLSFCFVGSFKKLHKHTDTQID